MAIQHITKVPFQRVSGLLGKSQDELRRNFAEVEAQLVPTGTVIPWAGQSALAVPQGWLLCDGAAVSRQGYQSLFNVCSTTYGTGDGSTTFNVPNLTSRFPRGATAPGATGGTAASNMPAHDHSPTSNGLTGADGAFNVGHDNNHGNTGSTEPPNHTHSYDLINHAHGVQSVVFTSTGGTPAHGHNAGCGQLAEGPSGGGGPAFGCNGSTTNNNAGQNTAGIGSGIAHVHAGPAAHSNHSVGTHTHVLSSAGSGGGSDNLPPYLDLRYIIKT